MANFRDVWVHSGAGQAIESIEGSLDVHLEDVHKRPVNQIMFKKTGTQTTPTAIVAAEATTFTLTSATGFSVGSKLHFEDTDLTSTVIYEITGLSGAVVTLDMPLDVALTATATVLEVDINMAVNGSLVTPLVFEIEPHTGETWHIQRLIFSMTHSSSGDDSRFGNLTALSNGCVLRINTSSGITNILNWKTNADMSLAMYDVSYTDKSGGGSFGTRGRFSVKSATGAVFVIDGDAGDTLEFLIQDDLTSLNNFNIMTQSHLVGV